MNLAHRMPFYKAIENERGSRVVALVTGERPGLETIIAQDSIGPFVSILDRIGPCKKLSLVLDTNGGHTSAAWRIINLIRSFCDELEVIVPTKAMSAGTLMSLGADEIVMTKQAALGPIDPSVENHPLAPQVVGPMGAPVRVSVSAEAVRGYVDEFKKYAADGNSVAQVWIELSRHIHPLVLGDVFRVGEQIRQLARELIKAQVLDADVAEAIIQLLCSDAGSHDYTINRRKAAEMGLKVAKPTKELYAQLSAVTASYHDELQTFEPYSPAGMLAGKAQHNYTLTRAIVESTDSCFAFVSEGALAVDPANPGNFTDHRVFEGWRVLP